MRHSWNRWGWDGRHGNWSASTDLSNLNLPRINFEWAEPDGSGGYIAFDWGNGNSDPCWSICYNRFFQPPAWLRRRWHRDWNYKVVRRRWLRGNGRCDHCEAYGVVLVENEESGLMHPFCAACGHSCCHAEVDKLA